MRGTFSLGALALLLSGSAMVPAIAESSLAASLAPGSSRASDYEALPPSPDLAIRDFDRLLPVKDQSNPTLQLPIAPQLEAQPRVVSVTNGQASWYGPGFYGGRTANGEVFRQGTFTAAHRHLPFGTKVRVTNLSNGRSAVVRINDRGPFHGHRVIDLAHGAANELGVVSSGIARVKLEVLQ